MSKRERELSHVANLNLRVTNVVKRAPGYLISVPIQPQGSMVRFELEHSGLISNLDHSLAELKMFKLVNTIENQQMLLLLYSPRATIFLGKFSHRESSFCALS